MVDPIQLGKVKSIAYVVLDSLRWDSFEKGDKSYIQKLGLKIEKCYSYASWTQPSHTCLLSGLLPHNSPQNKLASAVYKDHFDFWTTAFGAGEEGAAHLLPEFALALMAKRLGWQTTARVSMPVLNPDTAFSRGFDDYELSAPGSSLGAQIESLAYSLAPEKNFVFINASDTHYPYLMPKHQLPRISGVNGTLRNISKNGKSSTEIPFSPAELRELHDSQIKGFERAQKHLSGFVSLLPKPLLLIVASDHGELFGENNYFGHGPFFHPLLFEVPLAVGIVK